MRRNRFAAWGLGCGLLCLLGADDVASRHQKLETLLAEAWDFEMRTHPEDATANYGDYRYNDKLNDWSLSGAKNLADGRRALFLRLRAIDAAGLSKEDRLNHELLSRSLREQLAAYELKLHELPIDPLDGFQIRPADLVKGSPFRNAKDYEDYLVRMRDLPRAFDQVIELARAGIRDGLVPLKYLLDKVVKQAEAMTTPGPEHVFMQPVRAFPAGISELEQQRLRAAVQASIAQHIVPAYKKFAAFVRDEYTKKGRDAPSVESLPNGAAIYRHYIRHYTTTELLPEQIHALGIKEDRKSVV